MRAPANTNILLGNDGKNTPMTSVDPTTHAYVSRPQQLARRLGGDSVSQTRNSSNMRPVGAAIAPAPPARITKDVDDHVFGTTFYDVGNSADGSLATQHCGDGCPVPCCTYQRCDSRSGERIDGMNPHLVSEPPSPPRFSDMPQQQQAQQPRSITSPTAAMVSPLWGTEGAAAAVKCYGSGLTRAVPDLQTEGSHLTPHLPSHNDQHGTMASGDGELISQKLLRFAPYAAPSHRSPHITHTSPAAKPGRPLIPPPPTPPSAAPPSGLCSPGRLALQQSPQRLTRSPYSPQTQLRQLCNSSCSEEVQHSSAAAVAPLVSLSRGTGALPAKKRRCIGHSMSRCDSSRSGIDDAEGVLSLGRVRSRPPLAKGDVTADVCPVSSKRADEKNKKEVDAAPDCEKELFTAVSTILESPGTSKREKLSTGSQAQTQGPMSPTSHRFPKGCESPLRMSNLHSLASSTWENWSRSVTSNATNAFLDVVPAETPAAAAPVGLPDRASAQMVSYVTDAQRECASTRRLEANVNAVFNGSVYSSLRVLPEHHVLRALPAVQTSIDNAAIESALAAPPTVEHPAPKKGARVSLTRTPTWKTLVLMQDASRCRESELTQDAQGMSVMGQPPSRVPQDILPVRGPSLCNHKRRHGEHPRSAAEPAPRTSPIFSMTENTGRKEFLVDSSATLQGPISGNPQQPGRILLSNTGSGISRGKRDGVSRRNHEDIVSILKVRSPSVSNRSTHQHQQQCPSMGCARQLGIIPGGKYDGQNHKQDDATAVGEHVVPAVGVSRVLLSNTFPPMPELRDMQTAALRFHSVLQRDASQECRRHPPPPRASTDSLVETGEERSVELNKKTAAGGSMPGNCKNGEADEMLFTMLREELEGSATANNVWGEGDTGLKAHPCPHGNPSLSTTTPPTYYSATSRMRPSVCEAGMRRIHSDICFGTFISVLNSTRSSLDDYQPSSCLGDTTNELDGPLDVQRTFFSASALAPSASFVSPSIFKARARREYGSSESSSNCDGPHRRRKSGGLAWPSSSVASRIRRAHRDDDAATNSDRCSCSTSSHGTLSSRTSILSFAFGDENPAASVGADTSRRGSTASNKFNILQTWTAYSPQTVTGERRHLAAPPHQETWHPFDNKAETPNSQ